MVSRISTEMEQFGIQSMLTRKPWTPLRHVWPVSKSTMALSKPNLLAEAAVVPNQVLYPTLAKSAPRKLTDVYSIWHNCPVETVWKMFETEEVKMITILFWLGWVFCSWLSFSSKTPRCTNNCEWQWHQCDSSGKHSRSFPSMKCLCLGIEPM